MAEVSTPPISRSSSSSSGNKRRHSPNLSLDLSDLPQLSQPTPPSNTLIITNLDDPIIFAAPNLQSIKTAIASQEPLYSFSPLRSFRRIIVSFYTIPSAITIRNLLDGETVLGARVRVYFGETTDIAPTDQHLHAPESKKLFFISPPPSPPHGWEVRNEEAPNKMVHAEDLASALAGLRAANKSDAKVDVNGNLPAAERREGGEGAGAGETAEATKGMKGRSRSSTIVFDPVDQGHSPDLPAVMVEDMGEEEYDPSPVEMDMDSSKAFVHTARPPVELMQE